VQACESGRQEAVHVSREQLFVGDPAQQVAEVQRDVLHAAQLLAVQTHLERQRLAGLLPVLRAAPAGLEHSQQLLFVDGHAGICFFDIILDQ